MWGKRVVGCVVAACLVGLSVPVKADDGSVSGNDSRDVFVVVGSSGGGGSPGSGSGGCAGSCAPVIVIPACVHGLLGVSPQPGSGGCLPLHDSDCGPGERFMQQWTGGAGGWIPGGFGCYGPSQVVSVADIAAIVAERMVHRVPRLEVSAQPSGRTVLRIPVLFDSGQRSATHSWTDTVAGITVTTDVSATWDWDFGDGRTMHTTHPGSTWPDTTVSHAYDRPGRYRAEVTTTWTGTFTIAGLGEQAIDGQVTQNASTTIPAREAASVLRPLDR